MRVDFFFDPGCPWTWSTSQWLVDVVSRRDLTLEWRPFSLKLHNVGNDVPERFRLLQMHSHEVLRVMEAARGSGSAAAVGRLYAEAGTRHFDEGDATYARLPEALEAAGLGAELLSAKGDEGFDATIRSAMDEALQLVGGDVGSPIIGFPDLDEPVAFFGPVVGPPPSGETADALFDHVVGLAKVPGFYELKRGR